MASSASTLTLVSCSTDKHAQGAITKRFSASACPLLLGRGARTALRDCERLDSPRFRLPATENDDRAQDDMAQSIISRRHAEVSFNDGRFAVRDSSTHGLSLVRAGLTMPVSKTTPVPLMSGDKLAFGSPWTDSHGHAYEPIRMLVTVSHPPPPDSVSATEPSGTHHTRSSLPNFVYRGADSLLRRESPAIHDTFHSRSPPPPAVSSYSPELSWPLSASPEPTPQQPQQQQPKLFDMTTLRPPSSSARRRPVIRGRARRLLDELDSKRAASSAAAAAAATHSRDDTQSPERSQEPESEPEPTQMPVRFSRDTNDDDDNDNGDDEDDEQDGGAPFFIVSRKSSQEPGESFTAHSRSRSNSNSSRARHSSFIPPWLTAPRSRSRSRSASASGSSTSLPALPVRASDSREIVPDVEADDEDEQDVAMMTIIDDSDEYDKTQRREGDKDKVEKSPSQLRNAAIDALFATDPAVWSDDGFSEEASPAPQPLLLPQTQAQAQRLCFTKASRHRAASEEGGAYASTSGFFEQTQSPALSVSSIGAISLVDETLPNGHSGDDADAEVNVEAEAEEPGRSTAFGLLFFSSDDDADADAIGESSAENDGELITYERQPASNASSPRLLGRLGLSSRSPLPLPSSLSPRPPLAFAATHSDSDSEHSSEAEDSNDDEDDDDAMSVQDGDDKASVAASSVVEEAIPLDAEEHESKADTDDEMGEDDEDESKSTVDASEDEPVIPITQKHRIARRHPAVSDSSSDSEAEDEEEGPSKHEQDDVDDAIDSESLASDHSAASSYVYPHPPECREVSVHWQPSVSILPQDDLASDAESEDSKSPDEKEDGSEQEQDINEAEGGGASSGEEIVPVATTVAVTAQEPLAELSDEIVAAAESLAAETAALEAQGGKYHRDFEDSLDADQSDEDSLLPAFSLDDHGAMSSDGATDRGEGDKSKSNDEASIGNSPPSLLLTKSPQSDDALTSSSQLVPPLMDKGMLLECLDKASLLVKTHKDAIVAKSPPAEAAGEQRYEGAQLLELYKLGAALDAQCESLKRVFVADRVAHNFELVLAHKTLLTANDTLLKHATAATASAVVVAEVQEPAAAEAPSSAVPVTSPPPPPASTTQLALSKSSVLAEVEQTIGVIEAHKAAFKAQLDACCLPGATADVAEIYPKYNVVTRMLDTLKSDREMLNTLSPLTAPVYDYALVYAHRTVIAANEHLAQLVEPSYIVSARVSAAAAADTTTSSTRAGRKRSFDEVDAQVDSGDDTDDQPMDDKDHAEVDKDVEVEVAVRASKKARINSRGRAVTTALAHVALGAVVGSSAMFAAFLACA